MEKAARDYERFRENVPRILETQLIHTLSTKFLEGDGDRVYDDDEDDREADKILCEPSVCRFYAALLFIDISGFTILSQRLPVDELRMHINGYFKRIIDIVERFEGDVVKFAGDALFVIWPVEHDSGGNECPQSIDTVLVITCNYFTYRA